MRASSVERRASSRPWLLAVLALLLASPAAAQVKIKDLTIADATVPVRLVGYGLVTGLDGTGDLTVGGRSGGQTVQSVVNLLRRFDIEVPPAMLRTRNNAESTQRGEAVRQNRFQSEMSVRIVGVDSATGLLQLKGSKLVDVDRNKQEVTFTGFARPQDISPQNMVESFRVADAQLVYTAKGSLGKPKGGMLGRVLGMVWP